MADDNAAPPTDDAAALARALKLDDRAAMLMALGDVGVGRAKRAIDYYEAGLKPKRNGARKLRMGALLLGTAAGLTPLVVALVVTIWLPNNIPLVRDLVPLSAIFAAAAIACVAVDRLFGYSSAWMRFVSASLELQSRRTVFASAWAKERVRAGATPTSEHVAASLDVLGTFLASIDDVVRSETQAWVAEFRGALADLDKTIQATRDQYASGAAPVDRGAIEVRVTGVATFDGASWSLEVGGGDPSTYAGASSAAVMHLAPGLVKLAVKAKRGGQDLAAEHPAMVEAGKIVVVEFAL